MDDRRSCSLGLVTRTGSDRRDGVHAHYTAGPAEVIWEEYKSVMCITGGTLGRVMARGYLVV